MTEKKSGKSGKSEKSEKKAPIVEKVTKPSRSRAKKEESSSISDLKDLGQAVEAAEAASAAPVIAGQSKAQMQAQETRVQQIDAQGRAYATGRRKDAVARVWIKPGRGVVMVNGRDQTVYFARQTQRLVLNQPFLIVNRVGHFDVMCTVKGGGLSGQAGAVRLGIARALQYFDPELRGALKKAGMLTRDARVVERKKIGLHKARRSKQWAKR